MRTRVVRSNVKGILFIRSAQRTKLGVMQKVKNQCTCHLVIGHFNLRENLRDV